MALRIFKRSNSLEVMHSFAIFNVERNICFHLFSLCNFFLKRRY